MPGRGWASRLRSPNDLSAPHRRPLLRSSLDYSLRFPSISPWKATGHGSCLYSFPRVVAVPHRWSNLNSGIAESNEVTYENYTDHAARCRTSGRPAGDGLRRDFDLGRAAHRPVRPRPGGHRFLLRRPRLVWALDRAPAVWLGLDAARRLGIVAPLSGRPLGVDRSRLDLGLGRALRLGDLSLRPLVRRPGLRLGVGTRRGVGTRLGGLAGRQRLRGLGSPAAERRFPARRRAERFAGARRLRLRARAKFPRPARGALRRAALGK